MHVHQQRIQCVERQKGGPNRGKGNKERAGNYLLNRHPKGHLSSNLLDSLHGNRVRKNPKPAALAWCQEQCSCDAHVLLGTKRGPGWQTPRRQSPSQGPCARGVPLLGDPEKHHFKSTSATLGPKKGDLQQSGKMGYICTHVSKTQQDFDAIYWPALNKYSL